MSTLNKKFRAVKRWYRYHFPHNGSKDYRYVFTNRSYADEVAYDWMRLNIPDSAQWRGMKVNAVRRPPQAWFDREVKNAKTAIAAAINHHKFLVAHTPPPAKGGK